jgi:thioesterase domain-containing protein
MIQMITPSLDTLADLERTLHAEIPLTRAMGVRVVRADQNGLVLGAALAPNLNHKQTAFGGSLNSLATLACWGLIQLLVRDRGPAVTVVIQESSVQFLKPVMQDFEATCPPPPAAALEKFLRLLERKGRARLELEAFIHSGGEVALRFRGQFVAYDRARFQGFEPDSVV